MLYYGPPDTKKKFSRLVNLICKIWQSLWQNVAFKFLLVAEFSYFLGKIWPNLGFQIPIFRNASLF